MIPDQKEQKLLSICIPTYNRKEYLEKCLRSILPQVRGYENLIEVIISDNACSDGSESVINKYAEEFNFRYIRNKENIGGVLNVISCFENASGKYAWIFSDDDYLFDGALDTIIKLLIESPDILFLNNVWYENQLTASETTVMGKLSYKEYKRPEEYIERVNYWVTFLTSNIVKKTEANSKNPYKFSNTQLPQLGWILPASLSGGLKLVLEQPVIACKANNSEGYNIIKVFGEGFNEVLNDPIFNEYGRRFKQIINRKLLQSFFPLFVNSARWKKTDLLMMFKVFWPYKEYWTVYVFPLLKGVLKG